MVSSIWKCPTCGAILEKPLGTGFAPLAGAIRGTSTCAQCSAIYPAADVYGGKYDVEDPRSSDSLALAEEFKSAVITGDVTKVKSLIAAGADVHMKPGGFTILSLAKGIEVKRLLLEAGADVNARCSHTGQTPLQECYGDIEVVKMYLKAGARVRVKDADGDKLLDSAKKCDWKPEVMELLESAQPIWWKFWRWMMSCYSRLMNIISSSSPTEQLDVFFKSMRAADTKRISALIDAGADVDVTNEEGVTLLWQASQIGYVPRVQLLLSAGADVNATDSNGSTPLHEALSKGHTEVVRLLLEAGADANAVNIKGSTPLDKASCYISDSSTEVVRLLLSAGADVNATPSEAFNLLNSAASYGQTEVVRQLLEAGADANAADEDGDTPLHGAASSGSTEIVRLLLEAGADVNAATSWGSTPLHRASSKGRTEAARLLLVGGADVTAGFTQGEIGATPLYEAASVRSYNENTEVVNLLLAAGADVNVKVYFGKEIRTPLSMARKEGNKQIVELLIEHGAEQ